MLSADEFEKIRDAVPLITILIAGADGKFDKSQIEWAEKVTKIRSYNYKDDMKAFYLEVGKDYHEKLVKYIGDFPTNVADRNKIISERIALINPLMAKLDMTFGANLYDSFVTFAEHVAKSSGGIFGFFTINKAEAALIGLPMVTPITAPSTEEEEE